MSDFQVSIEHDLGRVLRQYRQVSSAGIARALAATVNGAATEARKRAIAALARAEARPAKELKSKIRVSKRADARAGRDPRAFIRSTPGWVPIALGKRFRATLLGGNVKWVARALVTPPTYRGRGWTVGRPRSSSPNLPIYNVTDGQRVKGRVDRTEYVRAAIRELRGSWVRERLARALRAQFDREFGPRRRRR